MKPAKKEAIAMTMTQEIARQPDSGSREYGAVIYQRADGSLYRGELIQGDSTNIIPSGTIRSGESVVGLVHNHPDGSGVPSIEDWASATLSTKEDFVVFNLRLYIVTFEGGETRVNEFTHGRDDPKRTVEFPSDDICN